jgi:ferredoxin
MAKIPYVDKENCTACGVCVDALPDVFALDDEGYAYVHNPNGATEEEIQEIMDTCPGLCIHWKEE